MHACDAHDKELLCALEGGNDRAFWTLWMAHSRRLFAVCLREMNGNRVDAEDALHEAMLRAHERMPRFASRITSPASWLTRMTTNVCRDIHRHRRRCAVTAEGLVVLHGGDVQVPDPSCEEAEPHDYDPLALVELLPDRLRDVFVLRILQRASYPEIARRLGLTCVTARKRVQQSRATLRAWRRGSGG